MTALERTSLDSARLEGFAERIAADQNAGVAGVLAYIGDRLGLWGSLASQGPTTPDELAEATGLDPTYLAEWLAAQAAAEYLEYHEESGHFYLPPEHAMVLADETSPYGLAGGFEFQAGCWADADNVAELFVTGGGLHWAERDERMGHGATRFFRPLYQESLVAVWLDALDGLTARLEEGAAVMDVGCGQGFATILMAKAFPNSSFLGIDPDEGSLAKARAAARDEDVSNVSFQPVAAGEPARRGWDLICFFDAFHHLGDPRSAARWAHDLLASDGTLLLVEPYATDSLADNLVAAGPVYYAPSTLVCLPDALAQPGGISLGAQAGPGRIKRILTDAGFSRAGVAETTEFNLILEAKP